MNSNKIHYKMSYSYSNSNSSKPPIQSISQSKVPRNFVLLNSIDRSGQFTNVQYGLSREDDKNKDNNVTLKNWDCTIVFDDGNELSIFELTLNVPMDFPDSPPTATFAQHCLDNSRINRMCKLDGTGTLNDDYQTRIISEWNSKNMEIPEYLMWLYNKIKSKYS